MAAYWEIAAHSAYDMFSKFKYLFVNLFLSTFGFGSENFFLIAPFPDHCLLVPFHKRAIFGPYYEVLYLALKLKPSKKGVRKSGVGLLPCTQQR